MYLAKNLMIDSRCSAIIRRTLVFSTRPIPEKVNSHKASTNAQNGFQQKVFSGVQPTGALHVGNYLGSINKWKELQESTENPVYCIADMHAITIKQNPSDLRENIFQMAATLLACGIKPEKATLFVQSAVEEHCELSWILNSLISMAKLGHLPDYRKRTQALKEVSLGLYMYPVLQAADILLHKATLVPVGEDQWPHINLCQYLAEAFNARYGPTFPICEAIMENRNKSCIQSLRDPAKKMSKTDPDANATIFLTDEPEVILEKVKRSVADLQSDVTYNMDRRPGVSNLIAMHAHISGRRIEDIIVEAKNLDIAKYKLEVAEAIIEHFMPIRKRIERHLSRRNDLVHILETGAEKARAVAVKTLQEVMQKIGLGASQAPISMDHRVDYRYSGVGPTKTEAFEAAAAAKMPYMGSFVRQQKLGVPSIVEGELITTRSAARPKPVVPQQPIRVEKSKSSATQTYSGSFQIRQTSSSLPMKPKIRFNYNNILRDNANANSSVRSHGNEYLRRVAATSFSSRTQATDAVATKPNISYQLNYGSASSQYTATPTNRPTFSHTSAPTSYSNSMQGGGKQADTSRSKNSACLIAAAESRANNFNRNLMYTNYQSSSKIKAEEIKYNKGDNIRSDNNNPLNLMPIPPRKKMQTDSRTGKDKTLSESQDDVRIATEKKQNDQQVVPTQLTAAPCHELAVAASKSPTDLMVSPKPVQSLENNELTNKTEFKAEINALPVVANDERDSFRNPTDAANDDEKRGTLKTQRVGTLESTKNKNNLSDISRNMGPSSSSR